MRTIVIEPEYEAWRAAARQLLAQGVAPGEVLWCDDPREASLFAGGDPVPATPAGNPLKVPPAFLDLARSAAAHTDEKRWALLYRLLWRLTLGGERHLLSLTTDREIRQVQDWCKAVGRDIHKMHAFVRFRLVGTDSATGREQFVAWFEPDHRIVRLAVPFFQKRFAGMDWSILTPYECAHWDGARLYFTPGVPRSSAPDADALDDLWRTYYRNIFNPARVKINAMQSEMPKKYWKNLPEAPLIADLIAGSAGRVQDMLDTQERPAKPAPKNNYLKSLHRLNEEEAARNAAEPDAL
jgi:uracil-DNA glycosylase